MEEAELVRNFSLKWEKLLMTWWNGVWLILQGLASKNIQITGKMIQEEALLLSLKLGYDDFTSI